MSRGRGGMSLGAAWLLGAVLLCGFAVGGVALGGERQALSQATYRELEAVRELLDAGRIEAAVSTLKGLLKAAGGRPYESAVIRQTLGHAHLQREAYPAAIAEFTQALDASVLPPEVQQRLRRNLAQLHLMSGDHGKAITLLTEWFRLEPEPKPEAYALLGTAYLQAKRFRDAVTPLKTAIAQDPEPKEGWYQALLGAHYELREYGRCEELLKTMVRRFPAHAAYWRQLGGIQTLRERYAEALATMELAYLKGHLEAERDLINLVQLYICQQAPYKGGELLEREIAQGHITANGKNWELAANAWGLAREHPRAARALEKAWRETRKVKIGMQLVQRHLEARHMEAAIAILGELLDGPPLTPEERGRAWLLMGIARFEAGLKEGAGDAFQKAAAYPGSDKDARQWLAALE